MEENTTCFQFREVYQLVEVKLHPKTRFTYVHVRISLKPTLFYKRFVVFNQRKLRYIPKYQDTKEWIVLCKKNTGIYENDKQSYNFLLTRDDIAEYVILT